MTNKVRYNGDGNRLHSPALWGDPAKWISDKQAGKALYVFDDFSDWSTHVVNTNANIISESGAWRVLADAGITVNPVANSVDYTGKAHGVLVVADADADNDEAYIFKPHPFAKFDYTQGGLKILYEVRFKIETVNTGATWAFGLALASDVAAGFLADNTGELVATANFLGFHAPDATGNTIETVYQKASQTKVDVDTTAGSLVSNTYIKLGLVYDTNPGDGKAVKFFIDGVELPDYVATAALDDTGFPDGISVVPVVAYKIDGTANLDLSLDWVSAGCKLPG